MIVAGLELTSTTGSPPREGLAGLGAGVVELAALADDDRAGADDEDGLDVDWREGVALRRTILEFALGGLGYESTTPIRYKPTSAARTPEGWVANISAEGGSRVKEIHGRIEGPYLLVDQVELVDSGGMPVVIDKTRRFLEWRFDEYLERPVAHVIEIYDDKGQLRARQTLQVLRRIDEAQPFRLVATVPGEEHPDPVRDAPDPSVVTDARSGHGTVTIYADGQVSVVPMPGHVPQESKRSLRYFGWIVLVIVVIAVAVWRFRQIGQ
jgi:hypothetical protein